MNIEELKKPFPEKEILWRIARAGQNNSGVWAMCLAYIDARCVMDRLDEVVGPQNWKQEFKEMNGSFLCGISLRIDNEWITKWDGAENTDIEAIKGGISGSFKRAAVSWGIGRYLYNLTENFASVSDNGKYRGSFRDKDKKTHYFKWDSPALPDWALPEEERGNKKPPNNRQNNTEKTSKNNSQKPQGKPKSVDDPGELVFAGGKFKDKKVKEIEHDELISYLTYWNGRIGSGTKMSDDMKHSLICIDLYLRGQGVNTEEHL